MFAQLPFMAVLVRVTNLRRNTSVPFVALLPLGALRTAHVRVDALPNPSRLLAKDVLASQKLAISTPSTLVGLWWGGLAGGESTWYNLFTLLLCFTHFA